MTSKQRELDQFSVKGKQLVVELKKIPECDSQLIKTDMEAIVDQWLDVSLASRSCSSAGVFRVVSFLYFGEHWFTWLYPQMSERIDGNIDRLSQSLGLWEDVRQINEDVESWTSSCMIELNESLSNFNDSQKVSVRLSVLQVRKLWRWETQTSGLFYLHLTKGSCCERWMFKCQIHNWREGA